MRCCYNMSRARLHPDPPIRSVLWNEPTATFVCSKPTSNGSSDKAIDDNEDMDMIFGID